MRKNSGTLNAALARVISELGHTDELVVTDAGLPIPAGVERIDLALTANIPRFLECLDVVLAEVEAEAPSRRRRSPSTARNSSRPSKNASADTASRWNSSRTRNSNSGPGIARAAVRSGEFTPYANVILVAGVVY